MTQSSFASTQNNYVGDGVTTLYPFTFEYIDKVDVKVQIDGTDITEYSLANATTVSLDSPVAPGGLIRIYRQTNTSAMPATFFAGSTIQARDLNDNFNVALFVSQEAQESASSAADALPVATAAKAAADAAMVEAGAATNSAQIANNAALQASQDADAATDLANTAIQEAEDAETVAEQAVATANAAAALVAQASLPQVVADVAEIPSSPSLNDLVEISDSSGIEGIASVSGLPLDFVGDSGIAVKILWTGSTWAFVEYRPTDPDARYATETEVNQLVSDGLDAFQPEIDDAVAAANDAVTIANSKLSLSGGTMTGPITFSAGQSFGISTGNASTEGVVRLSNSTSSGSGENGGVAATPASVKSAYDRGTVAINAASNAEALANTANSNASTALSAANAASAGLAGKLSTSGGALTGVLGCIAGGGSNAISFGGTAAGIRLQDNRLKLKNGLGGDLIWYGNDLDLGSNGKIAVANDGAGTNATVRFGSANTGLYYASDVGGGALRFTVNGTTQWSLSGGSLTFNSGNGDIQSYSGSGNGENSSGFRLRGRGRGNSDYSWFSANTESSSSKVLVVGGDGNSNKRLIIYADGSADLDGTAVTSDIKLKQNIKDARPQWDDIKALRFRNFEYIGAPGEERFGWIAQEVQEVSPGAVVDRGDHLSVKGDLLTWKGLKALQEAMARIEALEARIAELEG